MRAVAVRMREAAYHVRGAVVRVRGAVYHVRGAVVCMRGADYHVRGAVVRMRAGVYHVREIVCTVCARPLDSVVHSFVTAKSDRVVFVWKVSPLTALTG